MKNIIRILSLICLLLAISCSGEIDPLDYVDGGELRYPGKANDVSYNAGKERLEIQFNLGPDPNVTRAVVYWNLKKDSVVIDIDKASMEDNKVKRIIDNLPENIYNFEIYTYDKFGNKSVPVYLTGRTYGKRYTSVVTDRRVQGFELINTKGDVNLLWGDSILYSGGVYLEYKDQNNEKKELLIRNSESNTFFADGFKYPKQDLKITTFFLPELNAIDTFFTTTVKEYDPKDLPKLVAMKKPYSALILKGDDECNGWDYLWDNRAMSGFEKYEDVNWQAFNTSGSWEPVWFTVNVGEPVRIQRIRADFYFYKNGSMPKYLDVLAYSGNGVPPGLEADDPDYWKDWVIIHSFDTTSESEYPYADGDKDVGFLKGLDQTFDAASVPKTQYYRLKSNGGWADWASHQISLAELSFWAHVGS